MFAFCITLGVNIARQIKTGDGEFYECIGIYLGYTLAYYSEFYDIKHALLLGRVTSGKGGDIILNFANKVLNEEFENYSSINLSMPDESNKRVGQSIAAASLPEI